MKLLIVALLALGLQSCTSHTLVEEDPLDFSEPNMKMIASVKEVPREQRRRGWLNGGRRNVAGMSYFITQDKISGTMRFQYTGENGSVFHETKPDIKRPVRRRTKRRVAKKAARNYQREILAEMVKSNKRLVEIESVQKAIRDRKPTSADSYTPPQRAVESAETGSEKTERLEAEWSEKYQQ